MNSKNSDLSDSAVSEYLPENKAHVDLLHPEHMSQAQLLELFSRRGFGSLVSSHDPLHRLVDLYYDHIMPIPPALNSTDSMMTKTQENTSGSRISTSTDSKSTNLLPATPRIKPPTTRLEDLVITCDPRRTTPGLSTPEANRAERVLSVRQPKGISISNTSSSSNNHNDSAITAAAKETSVGVKRNFSETNHYPTPSSGVEPVVKKRVKLKRDFTNLV